MILGVRQSACYYKEEIGKWKVNSNKLEPIKNDPWVLWKNPARHFTGEIDGLTKDITTPWVLKAFDNARQLGYEAAVYDHESPKSPYLRIDLGMDTDRDFKLWLALNLFPTDSHANLDKSNFGETLVPIPGQPHWKYGIIHQVKYGVKLKDQPKEHHERITKNLISEFQAQQQASPPALPALTDVERKDILLILETDFYVQDLFKFGRWKERNYPSASEGRFGLIQALAAYRLSAENIFAIMETSNTELHWQRLSSHQKTAEIEKAKSRVTVERKIYVGTGVLG